VILLFLTCYSSVTALDLGLMHTIDFQKGCYTGQEIVAKTASNIRKRIAKLVFNKGTFDYPLPLPGAKVFSDGD
jgi:folate-binding Fe-S cluster repair protein YgfZ